MGGSERILGINKRQVFQFINALGEFSRFSNRHDGRRSAHTCSLKKRPRNYFFPGNLLSILRPVGVLETLLYVIGTREESRRDSTVILTAIVDAQHITEPHFTRERCHELCRGHGTRERRTLPGHA